MTTTFARSLKFTRAERRRFWAGNAIAATVCIAAIPSFARSTPPKISVEILNYTSRPLPKKQAGVVTATLFVGGPDSIVARVVGHAEGTRGADGGRNPAWYGHSDPGDGKWNVGTFSYSASRDGTSISDPAEADRHYLAKLESRAAAIRKQANSIGLKLSVRDFLNAIDLCNQAPQAGLGWNDGKNPGYVTNLDWARKSKQADPVLEARVRGFLNLDTGRYEAWTNEDGLKHDQGRRMDAIDRALAAYNQQHGKGGEEPAAYTTQEMRQILGEADGLYISQGRKP